MAGESFHAVFHGNETTVHWYHVQSDRRELLRRLQAMQMIPVFAEPQGDPIRAQFAHFTDFYAFRWLVVLRDAHSMTRVTPLDFWVSSEVMVTYAYEPIRGLFHVKAKLLDNPDGPYSATRIVYTVVDDLMVGLFDALDHFNDAINQVEQRVFNASRAKELKSELFGLKREGYHMRRVVASLRDVTAQMVRFWTTREPRDAVYAFELYDHVIRVFDAASASSELVNSVMDLYLNTVSNRLNEIVKTLTLLTTVLLPASLMAALYGMNFDYLPLAHYRWGFFVILTIIGVVSTSLYWIFRRRQWL